MKSNIYKKRTINRIDKKINLLGKNYNVLTFLNIRLIICLIVLSFIVIFFKLGVLFGPIVFILLYYLIEYLFFDYQIKKRKKLIEKDALVFFDLLLVALKSKMNLTRSISIACKKENNLLAIEFKKMLNDIEYGKSIKDSLNDIKKRIPSDDVNTIIFSLIETNDNNLVEVIERKLNHLQEDSLICKNRKIKLISIKIKSLTFIFLFLAGLIVFLTLKNLNII